MFKAGKVFKKSLLYSNNFDIVKHFNGFLSYLIINNTLEFQVLDCDCSFKLVFKEDMKAKFTF